ncbi:hypothetical protein M758_1G248000 [Ceratodon purpureus]|nr:hypothetical protein M758_1G248000 [Ceratodon purpureus]
MRRHEKETLRRLKHGMGRLPWLSYASRIDQSKVVRCLPALFLTFYHVFGIDGSKSMNVLALVSENVFWRDVWDYMMLWRWAWKIGQKLAGRTTVQRSQWATQFYLYCTVLCSHLVSSPFSMCVVEIGHLQLRCAHVTKQRVFGHSSAEG